jgi:L-2-hydroxyglutarate oxidase LhgO
MVRAGGAEPISFTCRAVINSAGLHARAVAERIDGYDLDFAPRMTFAKGSYFGCAVKSPFQRLIYPAPVNGGLGVHVTLDLGGRMRFGPDVEWLDCESPEAVNYDVDLKRADSFYAAVRRYWPALPDGAITPDYAGCRPKISAKGEPAADFRIDCEREHGIEGLVHLFGIESPGLTSALAIAAYVDDTLASS